MRTFISPIGFNSTSITRPVLSHGVDTGDAVVLLRPHQETLDDRAKEARADVERLLTEIEPDVSLQTHKITYDDFHAAVIECSDIITDSEPERIVNLGGGARDVFLPLTVAAITHANVIDAVFTFSDIDGTVRNPPLPNLSVQPAESTHQTLEAIVESEAELSVTQLSDVLGVSKSTITRHLNQLEEVGAVSTRQEGKTKSATSTLSGELLVRIMM